MGGEKPVVFHILSGGGAGFVCQENTADGHGIIVCGNIGEKCFEQFGLADIIAVNKNGIENSSMIKRVIALPGDSVSIDFDTHLITVNGKVLFEDYEVTEPISERYDFKGPVTVPENSVFVLGDNRNNSIDSRTESIGFITFDEISGKALTRLFPVGRFNIY